MRRAPSAIWTEVRRNSVRGRYTPAKANHKAYVRRKYAKFQGKKIVGHDGLRGEVESRLLDDQSPELIAGHIRKYRRGLPPISRNAIYRFIASPYGRRIETHRAHRKRKWRRKRPKTGRMPDRPFIEKRPQSVTMRQRIGDAEAAFIVSGKSGKGALLVVVDRRSRMPFLEQVLPISISAVHRAFRRITRRFPELRTVTCDNDLLLARYRELERELEVNIYFCHPYHSWEKGTVEHMNGVIRRDIPKGSDLSRYSRRYIRKLEEKLQRRPVKLLGFKTPLQVLETYRTRVRKNKKRRFRRHSI